MKNITLTGRLTKDPEIREVTDKKVKVAEFTLANNDKEKENAEYFDIVCWDTTAQFAENYLKKAQKVLVSGTFAMDSYKNKDGNTVNHFIVTAKAIEFMN